MPSQRVVRFAYWQIALAFVVVLSLLSWRYTGESRIHQASTKVEQPQTPAQPPPPPDRHEICKPHGFEPYDAPRKVYDLVLMANELDFLEIRLHSLNDVVDYFVIVEAATTFTGVPKPLYLQDNWDRYKDFHHKIIHHVVEDAQFEISWQHETFLRNSLLTAAHLGEVKPSQGDVILVSDLDEIPRPEIISMMRQCDYPPRLTLHTRFFYYAYQWKHPNQWYHPQATIYNGSDTILPDTLRVGPPGDEKSADLWDAGWHCSSCFKTIKQVLDKIEGFSHAPEWNTPENRDPKTIIHRYGHGLDLFGRPEEIYELAETDDVPSYVAEHRDRFKYLLDRTSQYAEFEDGPALVPDAV